MPFRDHASQVEKYSDTKLPGQTVANIAKDVLFPLASCVDFPSQPQTHLMAMTIDPVYLHSVVFSVQLYFDLASSRSNHCAKHKTSQHLVTTLQLLQKRLSNDEHLELRVADTTFQVVLALWTHAYASDDMETARKHMRGLRKMVDVRGGLEALESRPKLLLELLR